MKTYTVSDGNAGDDGLSYSEAVERIAEWYEDADAWDDGNADEAMHEAIAEAIASTARPPACGDLDDLQVYSGDVRQAVAGAMGAEAFAGHGTYYVSASDQIGLGMSVEEDD